MLAFIFSDQRSPFESLGSNSKLERKRTELHPILGTNQLCDPGHVSSLPMLHALYPPNGHGISRYPVTCTGLGAARRHKTDPIQSTLGQ